MELPGWLASLVHINYRPGYPRTLGVNRCRDLSEKIAMNVFAGLLAFCVFEFGAARQHVIGGLIQLDDDGGRF